MNITEEQFNELIATLALIEATGKTNGKARLGWRRRSFFHNSRIYKSVGSKT